MKIGLTGGIGCGKSTVVKLFKEAGWNTMESDAIVRELLSGNEYVRSSILERWGPSIFDSDGVVQRKVIAQYVFTDEEELNWLENLLHPLVRIAWENAIAADPAANWLIEIPLLFEKRLETHFDLTVCVTCPPDVVDDRMVSRGYTGAEIEQRRLRQMPLADKAKRADCVISNDGNLEFLKQQTKRLIAQA